MSAHHVLVWSLSRRRLPFNSITNMEGLGDSVLDEITGHTKSKKDGLMTNRKFVCHKEGEKEKDKRRSIVLQPRQEMRTKCTANLYYISFNRDSMKWEVKKFDDRCPQSPIASS
ncbi:hypothetical protein RHMOL_Rhmol05G0215500 [Rhododendron molle]|uniref:Uncharacterized protein n=1 Tax=Rhododendron molle TaxID=49168 RepID=A0ACC0NRH3_RHOML|nr:hypothetical protein RHMOL_Rhmol05G0215500 [Rhododendron molle]